MVINTTEYPAKQYYFHQYYANTYYRVYLSLEDWISSNIFRNDTSRVFLASPEYAFRRRFELTDSSKSDYDKVKVSSLHFPFASYWPLNSGWQADTRIAANTAAQVYVGMYVGNTQMKSASAILNIPIQFYFDREDDARLAYEKLFFNTFNPHYFTNTVAFGSNSVGIPVVISIKNLQFNPQFKESDWLKQNRIFVLTAEFEVRSYIIQSPAQPDYNVSVGSDGYLVDSDGNIVVDENGQPVSYDSGVSNYYIVNNVLLNFNSEGWTYKSYKCSSSDSDNIDGFPETGEVGVIYINDYNDNVDSKKWYLWSKKKGFYLSNVEDYDESYTFISFDSSKEWPSDPASKISITKDNITYTYTPVYMDLHKDDREKLPLLSINQFIWNPYTKMYERYNSKKLNANAINVYGIINYNTTKIVFLQTTTSGTEATINWTYVSQSHEIGYIKVKKDSDTEWSSINSSSTSYEISGLNPESQYTYNFEFGFIGDESSETNVVSKSITIETTTDSNSNYVDNSSLIGVKW